MVEKKKNVFQVDSIFVFQKNKKKNDVITVCGPRHVKLRFVNMTIDQEKKKVVSDFR